MDIRVASIFFFFFTLEKWYSSRKSLVLAFSYTDLCKCFFAADSEEGNCWVTIYNHSRNWILSNNSLRKRCWVLSISREHACNWTSCIYYSLRWGRTQNGELKMLSNNMLWRAWYRISAYVRWFGKDLRKQGLALWQILLESRGSIIGYLNKSDWGTDWG